MQHGPSHAPPPLQDMPGHMALPTPPQYYLRVDQAIFNEILQRITPLISRQDTTWRKALEPGQSLAITLCFMATGEAYKSMALNFYVGANSISKLVPDTCEAIKR
ncbi:hypothetical protein Pcinc_017191 [Petrolisthes cinctipes]|uniref:Uncharacterized protein n=1 Tax=Petrolisthes cinctipes TaxID=88211 RepID=A0AAE1KP07_PETCI|nr:hypothetical protein Pcinc_017191 [Petrolisthes cinctipes]